MTYGVGDKTIQTTTVDFTSEEKNLSNFINKLSIIFQKMGIDTKEVLETAGTKQNFLPFFPSLIGGYCIGVDPYYFIYKADMLGYHNQVILFDRRINNGMGKKVDYFAFPQKDFGGI